MLTCLVSSWTGRLHGKPLSITWERINLIQLFYAPGLSFPCFTLALLCPRAAHLPRHSFQHAPNLKIQRKHPLFVDYKDYPVGCSQVAAPSLLPYTFRSDRGPRSSFTLSTLDSVYLYQFLSPFMLVVLNDNFWRHQIGPPAHCQAFFD